VVRGYELLGLLGKGGMGVVYKARQQGLNRLVALKMILTGGYAGADERARFQAEAMAVARIRHPNVVQVFEVGEHGGHPFISLEFVEGGSLADSLRRAPLEPRQAASLVRRLAEGVHAAHQAGVIHRDLKPANVLLAADGTPKVTDFGLAKAMDVERGQTRTGAIVGTPSYMAPEQAQAEACAVGPLADVYSLGAVLYETLVGAPPFRGPTSLDTLLQAALQEPVPPRRLQPQVPADLDNICLKCLEKDPRRRYVSAQELADDLGRFLNGEPTLARPVGAWGRTVKWAKRRPAVAALSLGLGFTLVVGLVLVSVLYLQADAQRTAAEQGRREANEAEAKASQLAGEREVARTQAVADRRQAEAQTLLARRESATLFLDRGRNLCEQGDIGGGLLSYAKALELAPEGATDLEYAARMALAGWIPQLPRLRACLRRDTPVIQAILTPDGSAVLTGSQDGLVRRWDAVTGKETDVVARHRRVQALAISPDSKLLAVSDGHTRQVHIHNAITGEEIGKPLTHPGPVTAGALAFSSNGRYLLSCSGLGRAKENGQIQVWDVMKRTLHYPPLQAEGGVWAAAFAPRGDIFATVTGQDGSALTVQIWDAATGKPTGAKLADDIWQVVGLRFGRGGQLLYIVATSGKGHVVWDLTTRKVVARYSGGNPTPGSAGDLAPDGRTVVHGTDQYGSYYLHTASPGPRDNWAPGTLIGRPMRHGSGTSCVFSPHGDLVLTASRTDRSARFWEAQSSQPWGAPLRHPAGVLEVAFSRDFSLTGGGTVLTRAEDNVVRIWDIPGKKRPELHRFVGCEDVAFSPDSRRIYSFDKAGIVCFDSETLKPLSSERLPASYGRLVLSPAGDLLAVSSYTNPPPPWRIYDLKTNKLRCELPSRGNARSMAFSPDGKTLASTSWDQMARLWDLTRDKPDCTLQIALKGQAHQLAFADEGVHLLIAGEEGVSIRDVATGKEVRSLPHPVRVLSLAIAPNGKTVWTGGYDGVVRHWDLTTSKPLEPSFAVPASVSALAVSPDGRTLVTGTDGYELRLWSAETGQPLGPSEMFASAIALAGFRPDGKQFAISSHYDSVNLFRLPEPVAGTPAVLSLELQILTGMELSSSGRALPLGAAEWQRRRSERKSGAIFMPDMEM
jgi:WD40 repeat protein/tRNA A-37 threonylcarbamoyl transferase component Bud32